MSHRAVQTILGAMLPVAAVIFFLGALMLIFGLKGKRVGREPRCRGCGFDVTGQGSQCPECGTSLASPDSIRHGTRRRRKTAIVFGVLLLLGGGGSLAFRAWMGANGANWNSVKPVWLLMIEAKSADMRTSDLAVAELTSRLTAGKLDLSKASELVTAGLQRQAAATSTWPKSWGTFLQVARESGLMSEQQLQAYARNAAKISFEARERVLVGGTLQLSARVAPGRISDRERLRLNIRNVETLEGGKVISRGGGGGSMGLSPNAHGSLGSGVRIGEPTGKRTLTSVWQCEVVSGDGDLKDSPPIVKWRETFEVAVEVIPAGTPLIELVQDESLRRQVEEGLSVGSLRVELSGRSERSIAGMVNSKGLPIDVAYDVFIREPGGTREWKLSGVSFPAGSGSFGFGLYATVPKDFDLQVVDVVFRPSIEEAMKSIRVNRIWDGQVVFRGIHIMPPPSAR